MRGRRCVVAIDWKRVRRTNAPLTEEESEEIVERLNKYVERHRSVGEKYFEDEADWDYRKEEE
jgi:hypothetical protein|tara:strand:+ start:440 stop:628 length:189 start_codon:yes stop_codon:yes gene_type:complete